MVQTDGDGVGVGVGVGVGMEVGVGVEVGVGTEVGVGRGVGVELDMWVELEVEVVVGTGPLPWILSCSSFTPTLSPMMVINATTNSTPTQEMC